MDTGIATMFADFKIYKIKSNELDFQFPVIF